MQQYAHENGNNNTYYHIFDYVHIVKNLRNTLLNQLLGGFHDPKISFCMKYLVEFWENDDELQRSVSINALNPTDKMELDPVKELWKAIPRLKELGM